MGGQSLGPEVCFCMREVFEGEDEIDLLSWGFGMKDHLQQCWGSRAFWFSSRPVLALLDRFPASYNTLQPFEDKSLAKGRYWGFVAEATQFVWFLSRWNEG